MARIIWLHGAFGSGKTTMNREPVELVPGARTFDPEKPRILMPTVFVDPQSRVGPRGGWEDSALAGGGLLSFGIRCYGLGAFRS